MKDFLRTLKLYEAQSDTGGGTPPKDDKGEDESTPPETTPKDSGTDGGEGKTFTQEELDRIIKERLERERKKAEEKAEQKRKEIEREALEEQGKYKEMYEAIQKDLDAQKAQVLEARKETLLLGAGYKPEQVDRYKKYLTGESDDDLKEALETLKADIPPTGTSGGVDPATAGNGQKKKPEQEEPFSFGKELYDRLKKSGRLR